MDRWDSYYHWSIGVLISTIITSLTGSYFFIQPLRQLALSANKPKPMEVSTRFLIITAVSLASTVTVEILLLASYALCEECWLTYIYYNVSFVDAILNLIALWFSIDKQAYFYYCKGVHRYVLSLVSTPELLAEKGAKRADP